MVAEEFRRGGVYDSRGKVVMNNRSLIFGGLFAWSLVAAVAVAALSTRENGGPGPSGGIATQTAQAPAPPPLKAIAWESTFEGAMARSRAEGKPVMVDFYTEWCGACKHVERNIYPSKDVIQESTNWISVKVDAEKRPDVAQAYGVRAYPTIVFLQGDGKPLATQEGAPQESGLFVEWMREAYAKWTPARGA